MNRNDHDMNAEKERSTEKYGPYHAHSRKMPRPCIETTASRSVKRALENKTNE